MESQPVVLSQDDLIPIGQAGAGRFRADFKIAYMKRPASGAMDPEPVVTEVDSRVDFAHPPGTLVVSIVAGKKAGDPIGLGRAPQEKRRAAPEIKLGRFPAPKMFNWNQTQTRSRTARGEKRDGYGNAQPTP